ncbi:MAG: estB 3 [Verrucomicrobiaceae bacterium]|nr:estB 3 [Verrucomicrobiaceae bacterium]
MNSRLSFSCLVAAAITLSSPAEIPAQSIAGRLQPLVDHGALAGAVTLVADKDKVLDVEAVGYEDVAAKKPMAKDALFWIASMSKGMTTTAFMMLVDEGRVKLDDPVEKYLPEYKGVIVSGKKGELHEQPAHLLKVRDVMSHTGGVVPRSPKEPQIDILSLKDNVQVYPTVGLHFQPGTSYEYSNGGINTAGRIIEVISGMPYEKFMDEKLFQPLGMKDTTFWPNDEQVGRLAKSYKADKAKTGLEEVPVGQLTYPLTNRSRTPCPAGGLFSTAADVGVFCQMLLNKGEWQGKRYLTENAVKELSSRQTPATLEQSYGFGFAVNGTKSFGHGGAYSTNMNIDLEHGLVTVFMVQNAGWLEEGKKAQGIFSKAANELFAK